jgi:hypothetical protein
MNRRVGAVRFETPREGEDEMDAGVLDLAFTGELWYWRGPSPYFFVTVPEEESAAVRAVSADVTYGWGMIPVRARIGETVWGTAMFPKDGRYVLPIKDVVRKAEELDEGDTVAVELAIRQGGT